MTTGAVHPIVHSPLKAGPPPERGATRVPERWWPSDRMLVLDFFFLTVCDLLLAYAVCRIPGRGGNPLFAAGCAYLGWLATVAIRLAPPLVLWAALALFQRRAQGAPRFLTWGLRFLLIGCVFIVSFRTGQLVLWLVGMFLSLGLP